MSTSKVDTSPETILPMIEGLRLLGYEEPANRIAAIVAERDAALREVEAYKLALNDQWPNDKAVICPHCGVDKNKEPCRSPSPLGGCGVLSSNPGPESTGVSRSTQSTTKEGETDDEFDGGDCPTCKGSGEIEADIETADPQDAYRAPVECPRCHGTGDAL